MNDVRTDFAEPIRIAPAAGRVLLAMPSLDDPNFAGSVVYLLESSAEEGSAGVIVNRATRTPVGQVLPSWHDVASAPDVVFRGGPVQPDGALCLAGPVDPTLNVTGLRPIRPPEEREIVALGALDGDVDEIGAAVGHLRVYAGHAGWSAGQLEAEIEEGAWHVGAGRAAYVFSQTPDRLWHRIAAAQPNWVAWLSTYPSDPTVN